MRDIYKEPEIEIVYATLPDVIVASHLKEYNEGEGFGGEEIDVIP